MLRGWDRAGRGIAVALVALTAAASLGACGRRGQPELPPDASAAAPAASTTQDKKDATSKRSRRDARNTTDPKTGDAQVTQNAVGANTNSPTGAPLRPQASVDADDQQDENGDLFSVNPQPTPGNYSERKRGRGNVISKDPFILDPLL